MKSLGLGILFLGLFVSSNAWAGAGDLDALSDFDAKIQGLENYTVTFTEPGKQKVNTAHNDDPAHLHIKLLPHKKKKA
jgi:hypothetical protein